MTYTQILKLFDSHSEAARALGYDRNTLYYWRKFGVPYPAQLVVAELTGLAARRSHAPKMARGKGGPA